MKKDIIDLKAAHTKLGATGVWIDMGRFTKGTRLYNPSGLLDLFGKYSGQIADEVCDLMIDWIYDNYRNVKGWTRMAMQHKNIEINKWLEDMQKVTMHGDDTLPCTFYQVCSINMYSYIILCTDGAPYHIRWKIVTKT